MRCAVAEALAVAALWTGEFCVGADGAAFDVFSVSISRINTASCKVLANLSEPQFEQNFTFSLHSASHLTQYLIFFSSLTGVVAEGIAEISS